MINCPRCQVPNPDNATACAACGTTLVGQQFAQALDQAMSPAPPPSPPAVPTQAPAAAPGMMEAATPPLAMGNPAMDGAVDMGFDQGAPIAPTVNPAQAQAEINKFFQEQRARKRTKTFIYLAVVLAIAVVIGFFLLRSAQKKAREEEVARFFIDFRKVDDGDVAEFWKCTVRAKHQDVRLAATTLEITDGLEKAFSNYPKGQPDHLKNKCIPMINGIIEDLNKLKPPTDFADPLEGVKFALNEVKMTFTKYANKIDQRKQSAANEQDIRNANNDFHIVMEQSDAPKAAAYYNFLKCAIPDLVKKIKKINKPPDTQPVVEYIYHTCKADSKYADVLRQECFGKLQDTDKSPDFKAASYKMSGDPRDLEAINHCFREANRGFAAEEYKEIANIFIKYRNARGKILETVGKIKEEMRE